MASSAISPPEKDHIAVSGLLHVMIRATLARSSVSATRDVLPHPGAARAGRRVGLWHIGPRFATTASWINGHDLDVPEDNAFEDAFDLVIAVADGSLADVEKIAEQLAG